MKYLYGERNPKYYATDLHIDAEHGTLQWVCGRGQEVLLVRTPFGMEPDSQMPELCRDLERTPPERGKFTKIRGQMAVRFVAPVEKVRQHGCAPDGNGCTYTVFSCAKEGDTCRIFPPSAGHSHAAAGGSVRADGIPGHDPES